MLKRIMIVDDSKASRVLMSKIIQKLGNNYEVVAEAADGDSALSVYRLTKPDIIMLDITMPQKDGIETLKEIRGIDSNVKIIMCSAIDQRKIMIKAFNFGANGFVNKPVVFEKVQQEISMVLS